jgi:hypothetical protein
MSSSESPTVICCLTPKKKKIQTSAKALLSLFIGFDSPSHPTAAIVLLTVLTNLNGKETVSEAGFPRQPCQWEFPIEHEDQQ